jgi:hypothetical protein
MLAEAGDGCGQGLIGAEIPVDQFQELDGGLVTFLGGLAQQQDRQGRNALAQVGTGRLAGLDLDPGDVDDVVGKLERNADFLAIFHQQSLVRLVGAGEDRAELAGGCHQ